MINKKSKELLLSLYPSLSQKDFKDMVRTRSEECSHHGEVGYYIASRNNRYFVATVYGCHNCIDDWFLRYNTRSGFRQGTVMFHTICRDPDNAHAEVDRLNRMVPYSLSQ